MSVSWVVKLRPDVSGKIGMLLWLLWLLLLLLLLLLLEETLTHVVSQADRYGIVPAFDLKIMESPLPITTSCDLDMR